MEELFNFLAETLQSVLPDTWELVHLYSELSENSHDISFYCKIKGNNNYINCYNLENFDISENEIDCAIEKISVQLREFWIASKDKWTNCTFSLKSDGDFNFDIDYTDLTNCAYEYREQWKKKYLL
ncbi:MAG: antitoxin YezG family protein [Spirochaetia bacterium]|nr:antitoxin YezG family protein [Spirochaetia bacterium]